MPDRAGTYRSNLSGDMAYRSFVPVPLPPEPPVRLEEDTVRLLALASRRIGVLDSMSEQIPDMDLFISMYIRKEALLSSQIEGTQATLDDILDPRVDENVNRHVADVIRYVRASRFAVSRLKELPLCSRLIRETHAVLMQDVRGSDKNPGEFRTSQNWLGPAGSTIRTARYIPPHPEDMVRAMSDLEKFIHAEDRMDPLVKSALIHYQFETIHPFLDGNGRIGRLMIPLFLIANGWMHSESLCVSYYFKRNRVEYYDRINDVRLNGSYEQWVRFFVEAVSESARDSIESAERLIQLRTRSENILRETTSGKRGRLLLKVLRYLEKCPIVEIPRMAGELGLSYNTTAGAVKSLIAAGILRQVSESLRNRVFAYTEYLDILRADTEPFK
ncbi:MAG: Fic family protein [Clostridia bacterium]|nr:Fic family protein [Clostridia bacterium]